MHNPTPLYFSKILMLHYFTVVLYCLRNNIKGASMGNVVQLRLCHEHKQILCKKCFKPSWKGAH